MLESRPQNKLGSAGMRCCHATNIIRALTEQCKMQMVNTTDTQ